MRRLLLAALVLSACHGKSQLTAIQLQADTFLQNGAQSYTARYTEPPAIVDILFVVNNSPSMCVKQQQLEAAFATFLSALTSEQLDFHIGVVTTDFSNPQFQGQLVAGPGDPKFVAGSPDAGTTANLPQVFTDAVNAIGVSGSVDSEPLLAAAVALQDPLASGANAGFLRPDAALAIVVVTDKDDYSLTIPPSDPTQDPEPTYFSRVFKGLKGPGNDGLVTVSAIAGVDPTSGQAAACNVPNTVDQNCIYADGSAEASTRVLAVVSATGGIAESICESSFDGLLQNLGQLVGGPSRRFNLAAAAVGQAFEAGSLTVTVTPVGGTAQTIPQDDQNGWHYDPTSESVEFIGTYAPPAGAQVVISFTTLQASFKLSHPPSVGTITVTVTPKGGAAQTALPAAQDPVHGFTYDQTTQSIVFPQANVPPLGANIEVDYELG